MIQERILVEPHEPRPKPHLGKITLYSDKMRERHLFSFQTSTIKYPSSQFILSECYFKFVFQ